MLRIPTGGKLETDITAEIKEWLTLNGVDHWKEMPGIYGLKGKPDIIGVLKPHGRALFIEVKRPGRAKLSKDQATFLLRFLHAGAICIVAYSLDDVINALTPYLTLGHNLGGVPARTFLEVHDRVSKQARRAK